MAQFQKNSSSTAVVNAWVEIRLSIGKSTKGPFFRKKIYKSYYVRILEWIFNQIHQKRICICIQNFHDCHCCNRVYLFAWLLGCLLFDCFSDGPISKPGNDILPSIQANFSPLLRCKLLGFESAVYKLASKREKCLPKVWQRRFSKMKTW